MKPLSLAQASKVINMFDDQSFLGLRNQTIFILLFDTGIRLSELSSLKLADVDMDQLWLLVRGKGRKDRWVPFSKSTKQQLWKYIKQRSRFANNGNVALLINRDGTKLLPRGRSVANGNDLGVFYRGKALKMIIIQSIFLVRYSRWFYLKGDIHGKGT